MKSILALLAAGVITMPGNAAEKPAPTPPPPVPFFDATPLCRDGDVVGIQIQTNVSKAVVVTWPRNICAASST